MIQHGMHCATQAIADTMQSGSQVLRASTVRAKGWGVQPSKAMPYFWNWTWSKKKAVVMSIFDGSFLTWGQDVPRLKKSSGSSAVNAFGSIGLLSALLVSITASFVQNPPDMNERGIFDKFNAKQDAKDIAYDLYTIFWIIMTLGFLFSVVIALFFMIVLQMCADDANASAYLLVRIGKVQSLPFMLFFYSLLVGGIPSLVMFTVIAMHWITLIVLFALVLPFSEPPPLDPATSG